MPRSATTNIDLLRLALAEREANNRPGAQPSALATNAYLADMPLSNEQQREQDVLDARDKRVNASMENDRKAGESEAARRFANRTGVSEPGKAAITIPTRGITKIATSGAPPPPPSPAPETTAFGTGTPTTRNIRRFTDSATPLDPDAAMSEREKAMIDPRVLAADISGKAGIEEAKTKASADKLVKVEHKDPTTGRTVIEWLPENSLRGQTFQKGEGATAETRLASAQAVNQTGDDMIAKLSDPAYKNKVGVAMGRYNSLRDFIGNPPPEFAELAGNIESYSLANMGVHGMRSAQGAEQIKQLLDKKHTPESLISTIKGLNRFSTHFMENEGRAVGGGSSASPSSGAPQVRYDINGTLIK